MYKLASCFCVDSTNEKYSQKQILNIKIKYIFPQGSSKKDKLHHRLAKLHNISLDNLDIFTVAHKQTVKDEFLDVRYSAHGSPYYMPEKLDSMTTGIQDKVCC